MGMSIDFAVVLANPGLVAAVVLVFLLIKTLVLTAMARTLPVPLAEAPVFVLLLAQGGEFGFVVFQTALGASRPRDVLGTLMLGILAGSKRYAHIAGLRGDAVAAQALGLKGLVSKDSVRRALKAMVLAATEPWMREALMHSVPSLPRSALELPWVMDIDATVKPLYGHQEGAEIGYNPHKPGRPSHVLHTFWVSNLRLVLDAQLSPGKEHSSGHAKAALLSVWPAAGRTGRAWPGAGASAGTAVREQCGRATSAGSAARSGAAHPHGLGARTAGRSSGCHGRSGCTERPGRGIARTGTGGRVGPCAPRYNRSAGRTRPSAPHCCGTAFIGTV